MIILGVNSYHPDSSAAVLIDGQLVAACEEERFQRIKHFAGFPSESIKYCLKEASISIKDVDYIVVPRQPSARILKKIIYGIKMPGLAKRRLSVWKQASDMRSLLSSCLGVDQKAIRAKVAGVEHHKAHLASSFFTSGFNRAFLFSADALGDFASTVWARGEGNRIKLLKEITFPHSLGFYYTAITQYLGFLRFGDEYKVMGLAPYGEPTYEDEFRDILRVNNGRFMLNLDYFLHHKKHVSMNFRDGYPEVETIFSPYLEKRLGKRREPKEFLGKKHKDIAFCLQKRLEEVILILIKDFSSKEGRNLCLAGGVSHNCAANGKLVATGAFKGIYVPPAPGDGGLSIGATLYLWHQILGNPRSFKMRSASWGPHFNIDEIKAQIEENKQKFQAAGCVIERIEDEDVLCRRAAKAISEGKIVGWFQGRMEFGPRALGNRSIVADPRKAQMKDVLNEMVKHREAFRPFAPSILQEATAEYFEHTIPSPFMSFVYKIKDSKKNEIPAVCHIDQTARLQTVTKEANPLYWKLIKSFKEITGIPVLLNTSFNENEPIACSPKEAIECFLRTDMHTLAIGPYIVEHKQ